MPTHLLKRRSAFIELLAAIADMAATLSFLLFVVAPLVLAFSAVWAFDRIADTARDLWLPLAALLIAASLVALSLVLAPDSPGYAPDAIDLPAQGSR